MRNTLRITQETLYVVYESLNIDVNGDAASFAAAIGFFEHPLTSYRQAPGR